MRTIVCTYLSLHGVARCLVNCSFSAIPWIGRFHARWRFVLASTSPPQSTHLISKTPLPVFTSAFIYFPFSFTLWNEYQFLCVGNHSEAEVIQHQDYIQSLLWRVHHFGISNYVYNAWEDIGLCEIFNSDTIKISSACTFAPFSCSSCSF